VNLGGPESAHPAVVGQAIRHAFFELGGDDISKDARLRVMKAVKLVEIAERFDAASLTPQNIAQIVSALGSLVKEDPFVRDLLCEDASIKAIKKLMIIGGRRLDEFEPRNIAETLRGIGFLSRKKAPPAADDSPPREDPLAKALVSLSRALVARASGLMQEFDENGFEVLDVVTTLGAIRMVDRDNTLFVEGARRFLDKHIDKFSDVETAQAALFFAALREYSAAERLIERGMAQLPYLESRHIGMLVGAVSELPSDTERHLLPVNEELEFRLRTDPDNVGCREAVQVLDFSCRAKYVHDRFLATFCGALRGRLGEFSVDNLRETARGLGTLRWGDTAFFRALGDEVVGRIHELSNRDISVITWSFAHTGVRHDALFNRLASALEGRYRKLEPIEAANIAWAFAPLDNSVARSVIAQCAGSLALGGADGRHLRQLHTAQVAVGLVPPGRCPDIVMAEAEAELQVTPQNSFEQAVYGVLASLPLAGISIEPFEVVEGLIPDFVVTVGGRRFVIECDGEQYHLTSHGDRLGADLIQDRVFNRAGYEVIHILDSEWRVLTPPQREAFFIKKLTDL